MLPNELFILIRDTKFNTSGIDVNWQIKVIDDTAYLLFQESTTASDYKVSIDFPLKLYKKQENPMWIHGGFAKAYKSCNDEVLNTYIKYTKDPKIKKFMIAGWSFGGAMSQLAAEDFYYRTKIKPDVTTFGAPKISGGIKTRNHIRSCINELHMYAHKGDLITIVPPMYYKLKRDTIGNYTFDCFIHPGSYHCIYYKKELYEE